MNPAPLILIIGDTASVREFCELILATADYRVASASEGDIGLQLAAELMPDVILLDLLQPDVDGVALLDRLHALRGLEQTPILTTSSFDNMEEEALARRAAGFLRKPIDSSDLLVAVDAALQGLPLAPEFRRRSQERVAARRKVIAATRDLLLLKVDFDDEELKERLRFVVRWVAGYFGTAIAMVNVCKGDVIQFAASFGGDPEIAEGGHEDAAASACVHVVEAASPLVLNDTGHSPISWLMNGRFRFYAGVPLRTPDGVILGTVCLMDRKPHAIHAEDLAILEAIADGLGHRIGGLTRPPAEPTRQPDRSAVFNRNVLHALVAAELMRVYRDRGGAEIAMLEIAPDDRERGVPADLVYHAAGFSRVGVAEFAQGVLSIVVGAASWEIARERMDAALAAIQSSAAVRGVGVVSLCSANPPIDAKAWESLADELRVRSAREGGAIQRVVISAERAATARPASAAS